MPYNEESSNSISNSPLNSASQEASVPIHPKIVEYVSRVNAGENIDSVVEGLPSGMKSAVLSGLIPQQYKGLDSETLDFIWAIPSYADPEKTKNELLKKERALDELRKVEVEKEVNQENKNIQQADEAAKISQIRSDLGIQPKQSKLDSNLDSKSAEMQEGLASIESMSVEDFAVWLVLEAKKKGQPIDETSAYDALTARPEFRNVRIAGAFGDSGPIMKIFYENEQILKSFRDQTQSKMAAIEGTKYVPGTWDHYRINDERKEGNERKETHKGYITINKDQVLTDFTPDVRHEIVKSLRDGGYKGQVKFPVTGSRALFSYDNIVLHGSGPSDVDRGLEIVQALLANLNVKCEAPRRGVDAEGADGKKTSYTNRIAQLVELAGKNPNVNIEEEIKKLNQTN